MRIRIIILVMFAGILTTGVLLFTMKGRPSKSWMIPLQHSEDKIVGGGTVTAAGAVTVNSGDIIAGGSAMAVASGPAAAANPPADPAFQKFISEEAKQVNSTHIDSEKKRAELAKVLANLTPAQSRQLLQTARNNSAPAGERILSTYMLVEAGARAEAELRGLITAPESNPGPHERHSENELRAMQERSMRAMAIDGLISRAEKEPSAREALAKAIPDIPDPYIKSYAEKRLAEIKIH